VEIPGAAARIEPFLFNHLFSLGETIFNFTYDSPQNAYGKLESINYRNGKSLLLKYDYAMRINDIIQMPIGNKLKVKKLISIFIIFKIKILFRLIFLNKNFYQILLIIMVYQHNFYMIMDY
jgi:hypothetical protein